MNCFVESFSFTHGWDVFVVIPFREIIATKALFFAVGAQGSLPKWFGKIQVWELKSIWFTIWFFRFYLVKFLGSQFANLNEVEVVVVVFFPKRIFSAIKFVQMNWTWKIGQAKAWKGHPHGHRVSRHIQTCFFWKKIRFNLVQHKFTFKVHFF